MSEDFTTDKPSFPGQEPIASENEKTVMHEDPKKALQDVLDEVFDREGPMVKEDSATMTLVSVIRYATQVAFDRRDIMERQVDGTLKAWTKAEISKALMSLAELILEKVKELDDN